jgi:hypothetical protein
MRPAEGRLAATADLAVLLARGYLRTLENRRTLGVSAPRTDEISLDVSRPESPDVAPETTPWRAA